MSRTTDGHFTDSDCPAVDNLLEIMNRARQCDKSKNKAVPRTIIMRQGIPTFDHF